MQSRHIDGSAGGSSSSDAAPFRFGDGRLGLAFGSLGSLFRPLTFGSFGAASPSGGLGMASGLTVSAGGAAVLLDHSSAPMGGIAMPMGGASRMRAAPGCQRQMSCREASTA